MRPLPPKVVGGDPSKGHPAYALFIGGTLQTVSYERGGPRVQPAFGHRDALFIGEHPYIDRFSQVRTKDVIRMSIAVGQMSMHFDACEFVLPATWKGGVPKEVHQETRILPCLTETERYALYGLSRTQLKDVLDAVGIGLWKLRRL